MQLSWHNAIAAGLAALGLQIFSAQAANVHEEAVICFNCTYQQAVEYAKERATPVVECTNNSGVFDPGASQACYSQPRKVVVYDGIRQQGYGFTLSHSNQGGWPMQMTLQVNDRPVAPEILSLLNTAAAARLELQASLANLAQEVIGQQLVPVQSRASSYLKQAKSLSGESGVPQSCVDDRHARALFDAMDNQLLSNLRSAAQGLYQAKRDDTTSFFKRRDDLNDVILDSLSFGLANGIASAGGTFRLTEEHTAVTRTYFEPEPISTPGVHMDLLGRPTVIFQLKLDRNRMRAEVDLDGTRINGYPLRYIKANSGGPNAPVLSGCVAEVMRMFFDVRLAPGGFPQDPLPPTNPPYPGGPGGSTTCTYDVYTRGGGYSGSFRAGC